MKNIYRVFWFFGAVFLVAGCAGRAPSPVRKSADLYKTDSTHAVGAVDTDAGICKGDSVTIRITGITPEISQQEEVNEFGMITLPYIKEVKAEGSTPGVLARKIERAYIDGGYYTRLSISVTPGPRELYVRGEVRGAGRISWTMGLTVMKAIALAGGFSDYANRSDIQIHRRDQVIKVNGKEAEKDPQKDIEVYPRDDIKVGRTLL